MNGVTVTQASEFFELTVGSIINSILVGKRFDATTKHEFLKIIETMDASIETASFFDMMVPVWILKTFFKHRYDNLSDAFEVSKAFSAAEAIKRLFSRHNWKKNRFFFRVDQIKSGRYFIDENNLQDYTDAFLLKIEKEGQCQDFKWVIRMT